MVRVQLKHWTLPKYNTKSVSKNGTTRKNITQSVEKDIHSLIKNKKKDRNKIGNLEWTVKYRRCRRINQTIIEKMSSYQDKITNCRRQLRNEIFSIAHGKHR